MKNVQKLLAASLLAGIVGTSITLTAGCANGGGRPVSPEAYRYLSFTDVKRAIQVASADGLARPWRENYRAAAGREPPTFVLD